MAVACVLAFFEQTRTRRHAIVEKHPQHSSHGFAAWYEFEIRCLSIRSSAFSLSEMKCTRGLLEAPDKSREPLPAPRMCIEQCATVPSFRDDRRKCSVITSCNFATFVAGLRRRNEITADSGRRPALDAVCWRCFVSETGHRETAASSQQYVKSKNMPENARKLQPRPVNFGPFPSTTPSALRHSQQFSVSCRSVPCTQLTSTVN